jgi:hypothetical protein
VAGFHLGTPGYFHQDGRVFLSHQLLPLVMSLR